VVNDSNKVARVARNVMETRETPRTIPPGQSLTLQFEDEMTCGPFLHQIQECCVPTHLSKEGIRAGVSASSASSSDGSNWKATTMIE
jgi:hypothetical protein